MAAAVSCFYAFLNISCVTNDNILTFKGTKFNALCVQHAKRSSDIIVNTDSCTARLALHCIT